MINVINVINVIKYIGPIFILVSPIILLTSELIINNIKDIKILSLVITNLAGLFPASLTMYYTVTNQKNMRLEFIPFYFISIISGTYHLCDKINNNSLVCIYDIETLRKIDFSNSYLCVSTVILYFIKLDYISSHHNILKNISHILSFCIINLLIFFENYSAGPIIFILFEFVCFMVIIYIKYDNYVVLLDNYYTIVYLKIGIVLELIAYISYICTVYNNYGLNNYWWIHSYFWHIPSLLGAMFLYEALIMNNVKTNFFTKTINIITCNVQKISYNYISLNEFGIELMNINERSLEVDDVINYDDINYDNINYEDTEKMIII